MANIKMVRRLLTPKKNVLRSSTSNKYSILDDEGDIVDISSDNNDMIDINNIVVKDTGILGW